jgi:hypothetical protein
MGEVLKARNLKGEKGWRSGSGRGEAAAQGAHQGDVQGQGAAFQVGDDPALDSTAISAISTF